MPFNFAIPTKLLTQFSGAAPNAAPNLARALSQGLVQGVLLSGLNSGITATTLADIWNYPSVAAAQQVRVNPTAAFQVAVSSSSALDTSAGTGAQTIGVAFLDINYNPFVAIFALNGQALVTTAVAIYPVMPNGSLGTATGGTVANALRINGSVVMSWGTTLFNQGNIFITSASNTLTAGVPVTTTTVYDMITALTNIDSTVNYTIPAGYNGLALSYLPALPDVTATPKWGQIWLASNNGPGTGYYQTVLTNITTSSMSPLIIPTLGSVIGSTWDIKVMAEVSAAPATVSCQAQLVIWPINS